MIDRLARYIAGISFQRGLALGALVGAAIAGSTIWSRIRESRDHEGPRPSSRKRAKSGLNQRRVTTDDVHDVTGRIGVGGRILE